ncbi:uncharacterized protein LOC132901689 isoform X1 [Neoarius graeffei]|uniref:uncharacterized protein LOC132901689 isoform X1 n=1 Tax=Neoarius graeffei TaxID=443677 RepID=UPI00298CADD3|nr:uncharacterized protein LOC132901689 isoform X1 [Neoarius graeffei]
MNILIIFVLLFTFTPLAKGTDDTTTTTTTTTSVPDIGNSSAKGTSSFSGNMSSQGTNDTTITTTTTTTTNSVPDTENSSAKENSYFSRNMPNQVPPIPASVDENLVTPQCSAWISCCKPYPNITCWKMNKEEYLTELPNNIRNNNDIINTNSTLKPGEGTFIRNLDLRTILVFLLGMIFSTFIFSTAYFVVICNRCRTTHANTDKENIVLETVKSKPDQLMMQSDEDQADEQAPLQVQSHVKVSANTSAVHHGTEEEMKLLQKDKTEGAEVNDVDYATINYSLLQKKNDGDLNLGKVESDYAEIQLKKPSEREEGETSQDGEKQDEVDHGLEAGMESQMQVELDDVQV